MAILGGLLLPVVGSFILTGFISLLRKLEWAMFEYRILTGIGCVLSSAAFGGFSGYSCCVNLGGFGNGLGIGIGVVGAVIGSVVSFMTYRYFNP